MVINAMSTNNHIESNHVHLKQTSSYLYSCLIQIQNGICKHNTVCIMVINAMRTNIHNEYYHIHSQQTTTYLYSMFNMNTKWNE